MESDLGLIISGLGTQVELLDASIEPVEQYAAGRGSRVETKKGAEFGIAPLV